MTYKSMAILVLSAALIGCSGSDTPPSLSTSAAHATSSTVRPESACHADNFDEFIRAFENDIEFQKANTADPLDKERVDANAEPEPALVHHLMHKGELKFPLMPARKQQAEKALKMTSTPVSAKEMQVKLFQEDTDYQITFFFRYTDCWTLYRIQDDSL